MLNFYQAETEWRYADADWRKRTPRGKKNKTLINFYKKCWDNYVPYFKGETTIAYLAKRFPSDKLCRSYFPIGDFKVMRSLEVAEVYENLLERYNEPIVDKNGKTSSIYKATGGFMLGMWRKYNPHEREIDIDDFNIALALETYRNSLGIYIEHKTHTAKKKEYKDHRYYGYREADFNEEKTDIDGVLFSLQNPKLILHKYSIKSMGALEDKSISTKRYNPESPKLAPTHYIGYSSYESNILIEKLATDVLLPHEYN